MDLFLIQKNLLYLDQKKRKEKSMWSIFRTNTLLEGYRLTALKFILSYFLTLKVAVHELLSILGFFIFITIANQIISGIMLSFSYQTEPMNVPSVRDEEDLEDLYTDDFFWLHERGVDMLFVFMFAHLFRKLYVGVTNYEQEDAWKSGVMQFLLLQLVVFSGLTLCCTHLSDVTLVIAANALWTFFDFTGKPYWWLFTDKSLNTDTILRIAYLHYTLPFFIVLLAIEHGIDMHYDWSANHTYDGISQELVWWDEALYNELSALIDALLLVFIFMLWLYSTPEALSYEIFMWGDIGLITDIRYYGVAPHWYFRPYMAWLIICPFHRVGIFGLIYFFVVLYFQFHIVGYNYLLPYRTWNNFFWYKWKGTIMNPYVFQVEKIDVSNNIFYQFTFMLLLMAVYYTLSFLPYGRFYNRLGGNDMFLLSYFYIFTYFGLGSFRNVFNFSSERHLKIN